MTHVTCRLTAKIRDQVRKPTFVNPVRATFTFFTLCMPTTVVYNDRHTSVEMGNDKNNGFENFEFDNVKSKVYGCSSSQCNPATPVRELTCHMGSHSVTRHPTEVAFPPLPQSKLVLDLATPEECMAELP